VPNSAYAVKLFFVAMRDIQPGEELTQRLGYGRPMILLHAVAARRAGRLSLADWGGKITEKYRGLPVHLSQ